MFLIKVLIFVIAFFAIYIISKFDKTMPQKKLLETLAWLIFFIVLILTSVDISIGMLLLTSSIAIIVYGIMIFMGALHEFPKWEDWHLGYW